MRRLPLFIVLSLLLSSIFFSSCSKMRIWDDTSHCFDQQLYFRYTADDSAEKEHLLEYVDRIDVFFYNKDNHFLFKKSLSNEDLKAQHQRLLLSFLEPGAYRAVAVGNALSETEILNPENYPYARVGRPELVRLSPTEYKASQASSDPLYLGECRFQILAGRYQVDTLRLHSEHVKIETAFLSSYQKEAKRWFSERKNEQFFIRFAPQKEAPISSLPAFFNFNKERLASTSYTLELKPNEEKSRFSLSFYSLRFFNDSPLEMQLFSKTAKGETLLTSLDVKKFIADHRLSRERPQGIEITSREEALLPVYFLQNPLSLSVSVKPWEEVIARPIFAD